MALGVVHVQAWREAYTGMVPDNVLAALDPAQRAGRWRDGLARGLVVQLAEQDDAIIGFGSSGKQFDPSLPYSGEIRAIYVLRRAQRLGIGRALMARRQATCWHTVTHPPCSGCWRPTRLPGASMKHLVAGKSPVGSSSAKSSALSASLMGGTT